MYIANQNAELRNKKKKKKNGTDFSKLVDIL